MKKLFLVFAFAFIAITSFGQEKADINKSRSNIKQQVGKPLGDVSSEEPVNIVLNGKDMSANSVKRQMKSQLARQKVDVNEEELNELSKYLSSSSENIKRPVFENIQANEFTITITYRDGKWTITVKF